MPNQDYIFTTLPPEKIDSIHVPHAYSELNGNGELIVAADDGNESSYGHDIWDLDRCPGYAILVKSYGRDCFEDNLSDAICGQFIGESGVIDIGQFQIEMMKWRNNWANRTCEYLSENSREYF